MWVAGTGSYWLLCWDHAILPYWVIICGNVGHLLRVSHILWISWPNPMAHWLTGIFHDPTQWHTDLLVSPKINSGMCWAGNHGILELRRTMNINVIPKFDQIQNTHHHSSCFPWYGMQWKFFQWPWPSIAWQHDGCSTSSRNSQCSIWYIWCYIWAFYTQNWGHCSTNRQTGKAHAFIPILLNMSENLCSISV